MSREHNTSGKTECWCKPKTEIIELANGKTGSIVVHNEEISA